MIVVDHEPSGWFLVMEGERVLLDVNCSHGAVSYQFLMELNESERAAYAAFGHAFISKLAEEIQYSAPLRDRECFDLSREEPGRGGSIGRRRGDNRLGEGAR